MKKEFKFNQRLVVMRVKGEEVQYRLYSGESIIATADRVESLMQTCVNARPFRKYAEESERQLRKNPDLNAIEVTLYPRRGD